MHYMIDYNCKFDYLHLNTSHATKSDYSAVIYLISTLAPSVLIDTI